MSDFCNRGCIVTLTGSSLTVEKDGTPIYHCAKDPSAKLWPFDLAATCLPPTTVVPTASANTVVHHDLHADFVAFAHASLGNPTISTLLRALNRGYLSTFPRLTARMVTRNLPISLATARGHLDLTRQGLHSTRPAPAAQANAITTNASPADTADDLHADRIDDIFSSDAFCHVVALDPANHSDTTGRFPVQSRRGNNYVLVSVYNGYIHSYPMATRKSADYVQAFSHTLDWFSRLGHTPTLQRLDNETSAALEKLFRDRHIDVQFVPPHNHRANRAERAIRDFKNHLIAMLATVHPSFSLDLWDELLPQANLTINLLRPFGPDPTRSAYAGIHGSNYDFRAHPIAPCGTQVLIHEAPQQRSTWAPHGIPGFYLGPALAHYRSFRVFAISTQAIRITDTLAWFPAPLHMPGSSTIELLDAAINDLSSALGDLANHATLLTAVSRQPFERLSSTITNSLREVTDMFHHRTPGLHAEQRVVVTPPPPQPTPSGGPTTTVPPTMAEQRVVVVTEPTPDPPRTTTTSFPSVQRVALLTSSPPTRRASPPNLTIPPPPGLPSPPNPLLLPPIITAPPPPPPVVPTHDKPGLLPTFSRQQRRTTPKHSHSPFFRRHTKPTTLLVARTSSSRQRRPPSRFRNDSSLPSLAFAALNLDSNGNPLTYKTAKAGPNAAQWFTAEGEEICRLIDSKTIRPIRPDTQPVDRRGDTTYYNPQPKEKLAADNSTTYRIRGTAGGDRIHYPGEVSARTADMEVVKALLHSAACDRALDHRTGNVLLADIKDYYLGAPLERPEYVRIPTRYIPDSIMDKYSLHQYVVNGAVLFQVDLCMYGLPQAGYLSQRRLIAHLAAHGYTQCDHVPCLFHHATRPTFFTLVVDDFAVKYASDDDAEHLLATLRLLYEIKVDRKASKYLGFAIKFDDVAHTVTLSMPDYIPKLLERFHPSATPLRGALSPATYTPPEYGATGPPQPTPDDTSPQLSVSEVLRLQEIVGSLLFYARAVDPTMLTAVSHISSEQARPTVKVMDAATRLLRYAAAFPNHELVFHACDMQLYAQSDASYLSRSGARSVAGGLFYCGNTDDPIPINGPLLAVSSIIPTVCSSVSEAEYAALFLNAQHATWLRTVLLALGYPQKPVPILCDNACAVGIANDTVKAKRSKAIDMRYHWVRDRVRNGDLHIYWRPGADNLADFFTKALPVHRHQELKGYLVHSPLQLANPSLPAQTHRRHTFLTSASAAC